MPRRAHRFGLSGTAEGNRGGAVVVPAAPRTRCHGCYFYMTLLATWPQLRPIFSRTQRSPTPWNRNSFVRCLTEGVGVESAYPGHQRVPVMRRFEQFLRSNPGKPLYVAEMCTAIGVAERTLRLHCLNHLGMSPHRYLWLQRMTLAQQALARVADRPSSPSGLMSASIHAWTCRASSRSIGYFTAAANSFNVEIAWSNGRGFNAACGFHA